MKSWKYSHGNLGILIYFMLRTNICKCFDVFKEFFLFNHFISHTCSLRVFAQMYFGH